MVSKPATTSVLLLKTLLSPNGNGEVNMDTNDRDRNALEEKMVAALVRISEVFDLAVGTAAVYALLMILVPNDNVFLRRSSFPLAFLFAALVLIYRRLTLWGRAEKTIELEQTIQENVAKMARQMQVIQRLERELDGAEQSAEETRNLLGETEHYDLRQVQGLFVKLVDDKSPNQEVAVPYPDYFLVMFDPTAGDKVEVFIVPISGELPENTIRYRAGPYGELIIQLESHTVTLPDGDDTNDVLVVTLINRRNGTEVRLPHGFIAGDVIDVGANLCVIVNDWVMGATHDIVCLTEADYRERYLTAQREIVPAIHEEHLRSLAQEKDGEDVDSTTPEDGVPEAEDPASVPEVT